MYNLKNITRLATNEKILEPCLYIIPFGKEKKKKKEWKIGTICCKIKTNSWVFLRT